MNTGRPRKDAPDELDQALRKYKSPQGRTKIAKWEPEKRAQFEREVVSQALTIKQIAAKYDLNMNTVAEYKRKWLRPALVAVSQSEHVRLKDSAKGALSWMFDNVQHGINDLRGLNTGPDGEPIRATAKTHGTIADLLGRGTEIIRLGQELAGTVKTAGAAQQAPQIIQVINIPKAEGTPAFAPGPKTGPDYANLKLLKPIEDVVDAETE